MSALELPADHRMVTCQHFNRYTTPNILSTVAELHHMEAVYSFHIRELLTAIIRHAQPTGVG